ncbi:hypothetical protein [Mesorhizobium sp. Z1-4]|uniref:hypothetical protein n=1 Tax=Mesorhizobium sp. Z1-4 TaxID=2448478 RepID=UPI0013E086EB|nr:hypothetical protein [Mesorhizobium sp. Z1-4]
MTGRSLDITQRQVTALCKGAAKAGYVAEVKIGNIVVRLIPEDRPQGTERVDAKEDIDL